MKPFAWTCPFCNHDAIITESNYKSNSITLDIENNNGPKITYVRYIVCPNPDCREFTLDVFLHNAKVSGAYYGSVGLQKSWSLIPQSSAKVLPDYIPRAISDDYYEACAIKDLSPKASATLSRRCLQGMIRDFWGVVKDRLVDEIEGIKDKVDPVTWNAIDAVRTIGNIGAHMEKDINLILDVESEEAELLIGLIETLIEDWYVNRYERSQRLAAITAARDKKNAEKKGN